MAVVFIRRCEMCGDNLRFLEIDVEVTCTGCGSVVRLQKSRSKIDQAQLELFSREEKGPRLTF